LNSQEAASERFENVSEMLKRLLKDREIDFQITREATTLEDVELLWALAFTGRFFAGQSERLFATVAICGRCRSASGEAGGVSGVGSANFSEA
jgi:hypothetical protein